MKAVLSARVDDELAEQFKEIARQNDMDVGSFLRAIISEVVAGNDAASVGPNNLLKTVVTLSTQSLFLVKHLSAEVDSEKTEILLGQAESFLTEKGFLPKPADKEVDHA